LYLDGGNRAQAEVDRAEAHPQYELQMNYLDQF